MKPPSPPTMVAASGLAGASVALDLVVFHASIPHALLLGGLALVAFVVAWLLAGRTEPALLAALLVAAGGVSYASPWPPVAAAYALAAEWLVPLRPRIAEVMVASAITILLGLFLYDSLVAAALGGLLAAAWAGVRPSAPSRDQLRALRRVALFLPALALSAAFVLNAATGRADTLPPLDALRWSFGFLGVLVSSAFALLGLGVMLESDDPRQAGAWNALGTGGSVVLASLILKDPSRTLETLAAVLLPVTVLASIGAVRFSRQDRSRRRWLMAIPLLAALLQFGLAG